MRANYMQFTIISIILLRLTNVITLFQNKKLVLTDLKLFYPVGNNNLTRCKRLLTHSKSSMTDRKSAMIHVESSMIHRESLLIHGKSLLIHGKSLLT